MFWAQFSAMGEHDLAFEVGFGFEDAACNHVALDLGEPELNLVEPRGIGRRVLDLDRRIGLEKRSHTLGFVGRKIVGNNVDFLFCRLH